MAIIGGALSEMADLEGNIQQTGEHAGEVFEVVKAKTDAFSGDIEDMVGRLQQDVEEFSETVEAQAAQLSQAAESTNWQGAAGDAKRERIASIHANAQSFQGQAMANVEGFRAQLQQVVEEYYDHIAVEMGAVIAEMRDVHDAEAAHAASFREQLESIDANHA